MKVTALVRTLNEEKNIGRFCKSYSWCDEIIVSDSMSTDGTVDIAKSFTNTKVVTFNERIKDTKFTNQPRQINNLLDLAEGSDWIIYGDCDLWPSIQLQERARVFMHDPTVWKLKAYILHVYKTDRYFPEMTSGKSIWAWRPDKIDIRCDESDPLEMNMVGGEDDSHTHWLDRPYCLLHHFAQDEDQIQSKLERYKILGKGVVHPKERCGRLDKLPENLYV